MTNEHAIRICKDVFYLTCRCIRYSAQSTKIVNNFSKLHKLPLPIKKSNSTTEDDAGASDDAAAGVGLFVDDLENEPEPEYDFDVEFLNGGDKRNSIYYLAMRICTNEYIFQTPLSYYYIDTKDIPNNYEYDFKKYKII